MAISQVDIIKINEFLQGKVDSFYDIIPASTKMDLTELLEVLIKLFRSGLKKGRKDLYLLNTLIAMDSIINELSGKEHGVDFTLADETKKLKDEYLAYASSKGEKNDKIYELVDQMSQYIYLDRTVYGEIEEEKPQIEESEEKSEDKDIANNTDTSFTSLNQDNEDLRAEVAKLKKDLYATSKNEKNLQKRLEEFEKRVSSLKDEKKVAEKEATSLRQTLNQTKRVVERQTKELEEISKNNDTNKAKLDELEKLRAEVIELKRREKGLKSVSKTNNINGLKEQVKRAMISQLMEREITFEDLEEELVKRELLMDRRDLFLIFKEIYQEYKIVVECNSKTGSPCYHIDKPIPKFYRITSITTPSHKEANHLDIMLTSDWHTYSLDDINLFRKIDLLLDYCAYNRISTMINLGDFYDYQLDSSLTRAQNSLLAKNRLEELAQKIPYQKNLTHYILGGNHDEHLRRCRLDTLSILESMRPDILSLGYYHAILDINGTFFGLHHPNSKFNTLKEYSVGLNNCFLKCPYSADDMYMNLFGHSHEYKLFPLNGILSCPSLARDFKMDGAIHLCINFDSYGKVLCVEIIPLNIRSSVRKCKREVYPKKAKKI